MKEISSIRQSRLVAALPGLLFLAVFSLYAYTAVPGIYPRDSAELIVAVHTVGIAHAPGYPLYVLLGKLFELLVPFGSVAFQVNLFSAFTASLAIVLAFLILKRVTGAVLPALLGALVLATSRLFWFYATIAEVFGLYVFWILLLIWLLLIWQQRVKAGRSATGLLYFGAVLYGLGFGNHHTIIFILPGILYFIWVTDRRPGRLLTLLKLGGVSLLGVIAIYSFVYLRSKTNPFMDWGDPETLPNLLAVFFRREFGTFSFSKQFNASWSLANCLAHCQFYLTSLYRQFFSWGIALGLGGLVYLFKKQRPFAWLTTLAFLGLGPLLVLLVSPLITDDNIHFVIEKIYLASFVIFSLWIGGGIWWLLMALKALPARVHLAAGVTAIVILISLAASGLITNWTQNNRHAYQLDEQLIRNIFASMAPDAILITPNDSVIFGAWYVQQIEGQRLDISIIPTISSPVAISQLRDRFPRLLNGPATDNTTLRRLLFPPNASRSAFGRLLKDIIEKNIDRRPIYFTVGDPSFTTPLAEFLTPRGVVHQLTARRNEPDPALLKPMEALLESTYQFPRDNLISDKNHFLDNEILMRYAIAYNDLGVFFRAVGDYDTAQTLLKKSLAIDPTSAATQGNLALTQSFPPLEAQLLKNPGDGALRQELAARYFQTKQFARSATLLEQLIKERPNDASFRFAYGQAMSKLSRWPEATRSFQKALELQPDLIVASNELERIKYLTAP